MFLGTVLPAVVNLQTPLTCFHREVDEDVADPELWARNPLLR